MAGTPGSNSFQIDNFMSHLSSAATEPARSALFKCKLASPGGKTLTTAPATLTDNEFLVRATSLPGLTITPIERQYLGRTIKIPGDMTFAELAVTVINDDNYHIRNAIETWMAGINSHEENKRHFGSKFTNETADLELSILNRAGTATAGNAYTFVDSWPTAIDPIELSWDTASDIEEFGITFAYQYYTVDIAEASDDDG